MPNSRCIETGAREGVYLGSQLPVDAVPGRSGQVQANPGAALDRRTNKGFSAGKSCFLEILFETCISMLRQWEGKSDEFPCF